MKRSSHASLTKFGMKTWFQRSKIQEVSEEEIKKFLKQTKTQESIAQIDISCAYKAYQAVTGNCNIGYLHKKNIRTQLKDNIIENIKIKCKAVVATHSFLPLATLNISLQERLENEGAQMILEEQDLSSLQIKSFLMQENESIAGVAEMISSYLLFSEIDNSIKQQNVSLQNLLNNPLLDGRLYQPIGAHSWIINLSWMLAHFHHGSNFLVCSDISKDNLYRKTGGYTHQISGFAREIAVALKCGYKFDIHDQQIAMVHNTPASLENLSLADIAMTQEEFCAKYMEAVVACEALKSEVKEEEEKISKKPRISSDTSSKFFCPLSSSSASLKSSGSNTSNVSSSSAYFSTRRNFFDVSIELGADKTKKKRKIYQCSPKKIISSKKTITPIEALLLNSPLSFWPFTTNFPIPLLPLHKTRYI